MQPAHVQLVWLHLEDHGPKRAGSRGAGDRCGVTPAAEWFLPLWGRASRRPLALSVLALGSASGWPAPTSLPEPPCPTTVSVTNAVSRDRSKRSIFLSGERMEPSFQAGPVSGQLQSGRDKGEREWRAVHWTVP